MLQSLRDNKDSIQLTSDTSKEAMQLLNQQITDDGKIRTADHTVRSIPANTTTINSENAKLQEKAKVRM